MAKAKSSVQAITNNDHSRESDKMQTDPSATGTDSNRDSLVPTFPARTIKVGKQELLIVKMVHTKGKDVEEGDYPVVVVKGQRKVVVGTGEGAELRSFSAFGGTVWAKTNRSPAPVNELPANAVLLTAKTIKILTAIQAACGAENIAEIIESSLPALASANLINDALYERLVARVEKSTANPV
jgi:hypothetical protein